MKTCPSALGLLAIFLAANDAHAMGAKPAEPTAPAAPLVQQAKPYRYVELSSVTVPSFYLPDGNRADYNLDLNALIETKVNESRYFRTRASSAANPTRLTFAGGITSFEANVVGSNLKVGWNKAGVILPGQTVTGEVTLRLSSLTMDFLVYDRVQRATRLSASTEQTMSDVNLEVKVNLANLNATLTSFYKEVLSAAAGRAMADVMAKLENRVDFDSVYWSAPVLGVDLNQNYVVLSAGSADRVQVGDIYSLYSACTAAETESGQCFPRFLADVRVYQVGQATAQARPYTAADSLGQVRAGDEAQVKPNVAAK